MRRLQIYTWWWSSGVRITRFVGLMRHTPGASCPPPRPNGSLCSSNTEVCQFVRFGNLALSWMTLASLSWMFFKIAYRLGRRSAAKGIDQVEGSCFVEESKKNRKRRTNPCLMPVKLKFFVAYRNLPIHVTSSKPSFAHTHGELCCTWWMEAMLFRWGGSHLDVATMNPTTNCVARWATGEWVDFKELCWESCWWKWKVRNHEIWKIASLRDLRQCWNLVPSGAWLDSFVLLCHTSFQGVWFREKF